MRRHRDQKLLDRARRQANTKQAKLDRKRRQHLIERSFADASNLHGFKRARWRGLIKQTIQDLLIAVVQNLRKLIAAIHNASENIYLALIDALISLLQAFTTLLTTDLPFHTRSTSSLAAVDSWQHPLSPGVRATARRNGKYYVTDLERMPCSRSTAAANIRAKVNFNGVLKTSTSRTSHRRPPGSRP
jgi:hypothetical protein